MTQITIQSEIMAESWIQTAEYQEDTEALDYTATLTDNKIGF